MEFKAVKDRLYVEPIKQDDIVKKEGSEILLTSKSILHETAKVISVGSDVVIAKEGDVVMYLKNSGVEINSNGKPFLLLREEQIDGVSSN